MEDIFTLENILVFVILLSVLLFFLGIFFLIKYLKMKNKKFLWIGLILTLFLGGVAFIAIRMYLVDKGGVGYMPYSEY